MNSILVKLPNWIGDILFSYDLLYSLSQNLDRLVMLTSQEQSELLQIFPIPRSEVVTYASNEWPRLKRNTLIKINELGLDSGLLLPNSIGSALTLRRAGIRHLYGYDTERRSFLLERSLPCPDYKVPMPEYYLGLLKLFGFQPEHYPVSTSVVKNKVVLLHPGASKIQRAWNLDRFIQLAEALRQKGFEVQFVSGEDLPVGSFPLKIKPSLKEFSNLLRNCSLFIGNDSGPMHLAQQCGAAVVGIYGPGDPLVTGPRTLTPHRVIYHSYPCSPCRQKFFKECNPAPSGKPYCIETITTEEVLRASLELLATDITDHTDSPRQGR